MNSQVIIEKIYILINNKYREIGFIFGTKEEMNKKRREVFERLYPTTQKFRIVLQRVIMN